MVVNPIYNSDVVFDLANIEKLNLQGFLKCGITKLLIILGQVRGYVSCEICMNWILGGRTGPMQAYSRNGT